MFEICRIKFFTNVFPIHHRNKIFDYIEYFFCFIRKPEINAATPQRNPPPRPETHNREKRHSLTSLTVPHHNTSTHRHSAEILGTETDVQQQPVELPRRMVVVDSNVGGVHLPAAYIALYAYKPQKPDELELRKGGIYMVTERCQDGWFKGK